MFNFVKYNLILFIKKIKTIKINAQIRKLAIKKKIDLIFMIVFSFYFEQKTLSKNYKKNNN